MHLFLNAIAASAASGFTYVRNVVPHLMRRPDVKSTVLTSELLRDEFSDTSNLKFLVAGEGWSAARRSWFEQRELPKLLHSSRADILISAGNFALRGSPVPQILLSGNALYFCDDFSHDLIRRHAYRAWVDLKIRAWLAKRSVHWSDCTVAPSQAFADKLRNRSSAEVVAVHHGFDEDLFKADNGPLPATLESKLAGGTGTLRLFCVSHYNYFRNFETTFRALSLVQKQLPAKKVQLLITCELKPSAETGSYDPRRAAVLVRQLGIEENVLQLGVVPYRFLHHVYKACDVYVTASYAETFAHPTLEAMSCELPIVASDLRVHQEICSNAALYFPRFSPELLAQRIVEIATTPDLRTRMTKAGQDRIRDFSWKAHVDRLITIGTEMVARTRPTLRTIQNGSPVERQSDHLYTG